MKQRKTRTMRMDADDVTAGFDTLVIQGVDDDGRIGKRVTITLTMTTAEYIARECICWIVRRRDRAAAALADLRAVDKP